MREFNTATGLAAHVNQVSDGFFGYPCRMLLTAEQQGNTEFEISEKLDRSSDYRADHVMVLGLQWQCECGWDCPIAQQVPPKRNLLVVNRYILR